MTSPPHPRPVPVAGRVARIEPIEGSDLVRLAQVDVGQPQLLTIVFGGERVVQENDIVPVAPPGTRVPGPRGDRDRMVKMRRRRYRGWDSYGMLCSLLELGYSRASADRVAVLRDDLEPGSPLPTPAGWRHVVVQPDPSDFDPNTEELSLDELRYLLGRPAPRPVRGAAEKSG